MRKLALMTMLLWTASVAAQSIAHQPIRLLGSSYEKLELKKYLEKGGLKTFIGQTADTASYRVSIHVGDYFYFREHYANLVDSLRDDGYLIASDGNDVCLYGKGSKGTLYAVYAFLEMLGYRLYTPDALVVPDISNLQLPQCLIVSNPAFTYRELSYHYPHDQLYADWHHLHNENDRNSTFGLFVHTFGKLLPPSEHFERHPEWYSLNNGRRMRDGQLCLSNPKVVDSLCAALARHIASAPQRKIWSVSPNDNYNACECDNCRRLDSLYGGPSGTLLWFVNQVARRFPDKTISTLAYQYTRKAPTSDIKPEPNVNIMLCPIEVGREKPIAASNFAKDMEDWSRLTDYIFLWDYVVQFRNFWNPFPNLHVLQPNLQYFRDHGASMMFEQATGYHNITSWMDIRCYMLAKLLWNPDANIDSIMADFYKGYYGDAGSYVKEIIDTMTSELVRSGQALSIYGYPVDGAEGYLKLWLFDKHYRPLMRKAYSATEDETIQKRLRYFEMALDFAAIDLKTNDMYGDFELKEIQSEIDSLVADLNSFGVPQMMEMGNTPSQYGDNMRRWFDKTFSRAKAYEKPVSLRKPATAPYNTASLTDGEAGILDYRHRWLGFWGDTLDAVIDLGEPVEISNISLDFYFYPLSWIFLPQHVLFAVSADGEHWEWRGRHEFENPEVLATPQIVTYTLENVCTIGGVSAKYRYVRVIAEPLSEIPAWHRAAGQKAWIFTDEIIIK